MPKKLGGARSTVGLALSLTVAGFVGARSAAAAQVVASSTDSVAIAGLLNGNVLVPLAQYVHGRWVRTWPRPDEQIETPIHARQDVPHSWYPIPGGVPREWRLWTEGANADEALGTGRPVLAEAHCEHVWGLSASRRQEGQETTAIASHGPAVGRPFVPSAVDALSDAALLAVLERQASRLESDAIGRARAGNERTYNARCARLDESSELCSFEGLRTLNRQPESDEGYEQVVVVQGWFLRGSDGPTYLQGKATLTDSDFKEFRSFSPLLLIRTDARTFVLVKEHGYEDESFAVLELQDRRLEKRLEIEGGGC